MPHLTPHREVSAETDAKGSRFIAHLIPIASFEARVADLTAAHRKASHVVTATRIMGTDGQVLDRAKDDGEPGGTAGMPALKVLIGAQIVEAGVAIVRYFGGTKLGTGGLARAYASAAAAAVDAATLVEWKRMAERTVKASFAEASTLEQTIAALPLTILTRTHTETGVTLKLRGPEDILTNLQ